MGVFSLFHPILLEGAPRVHFVLKKSFGLVCVSLWIRTTFANSLLAEKELKEVAASLRASREQQDVVGTPRKPYAAFSLSRDVQAGATGRGCT